jgi:hypothetical protein
MQHTHRLQETDTPLLDDTWQPELIITSGCILICYWCWALRHLRDTPDFEHAQLPGQSQPRILEHAGSGL